MYGKKGHTYKITREPFNREKVPYRTPIPSTTVSNTGYKFDADFGKTEGYV